MSATLHDIVRAYRPDLPLEEAATIPSAWYTDPRVHELEREAVFSRNWVIAGRLDQLREEGQYVTADIAGEPIVVVHGRDGVLRGFYNVCRHHAAEVVREAAGTVRKLRCPYHGWTYSLEGELKGPPDFEGVRGFDKSRNGLVPIRVETWENFVFACLDPDSAGLPEFLGGLVERLDPLHLGDLRFVERRTYELDCNWKVFVDNYLDGGYHVPHIHKGLGSVLSYPNYKIENVDRCCVQSSPISAKKGDPATAAVRGGEMAYYFWQYANFMINWYEGIMDTNLALPLGVDRTRVVFDFYFAETDETAEARNRQSIAIADRVQEEDIAICESVQRGLKSRAYGVGRLSVRREAGEQLFHRLLYHDLERELERGGAGAGFP